MAQPHENTVSQSLARIAIFKGLSPDAKERIWRACAARRYQAEEPIVACGDDTSEVFFIIEGDARVTIYSIDGKVVSFRELGAGDVFGEYAAIDRSPRSASVEAKTSCLVASMSAEAFRNLLRTEPEVSEALLEHLVTELRELTTRVYEFSTLCVKNRIQAELLRLARRRTPEGKAVRIFPVPTHAEIASRISTHREAVTRELNRLAKNGIIEQQKHALLVKDVDRLVAMVHEVTGE